MVSLRQFAVGVKGLRRTSAIFAGISDHLDPSGVRIRQRLNQDRVDRAEDRCRAPNTEAQDRNREARIPRVLSQLSDGIAQILHESTHVWFRPPRRARRYGLALSDGQNSYQSSQPCNHLMAKGMTGAMSIRTGPKVFTTDLQCSKANRHFWYWQDDLAKEAVPIPASRSRRRIAAFHCFHFPVVHPNSR